MNDFTWFVVGIAGGAGLALCAGYAVLVRYLTRGE